MGGISEGKGIIENKMIIFQGDVKS